MSVAEKPAMEQIQRNPYQQLAIGSAVGAVALLAGLGIIFAGLPVLWDEVWKAVWERGLEYKKNDFLSEALLILVELIAIGALMFVGYAQLQKHTLPALRAGSFFAAIALFFALWIGMLLGSQLEKDFDPALGWVIVIAVVGAIMAGVGYLFLKVPAWTEFLEAVEHQGWFHGVPYKGNQGVRVRRGTIVGILAIGVFGIITAVQHHLFGAERAEGNDWYWVLPFTRDPRAFTYYYLPLLFKIHLLMPIICTVGLFWIAWRTVNVPIFADFLIATEAEMNKVSWTNRRRLLQDTIVVLVTVFLFTTFLFVVDILWIQILSAPYIKVLLIDPAKEQQKQQEKAQW